MLAGEKDPPPEPSKLDVWGKIITAGVLVVGFWIYAHANETTPPGHGKRS